MIIMLLKSYVMKNLCVLNWYIFFKFRTFKFILHIIQLYSHEFGLYLQNIASIT